MNTKEILFQKALTDQMKGAAEFLQIDLSRIVHQIEKNGALPYVQHLLHRGLESPAFLDLAKNDRLSLSLEAVVVRPEFGELFSDEVVNLCFERLCENAYF